MDDISFDRIAVIGAGGPTGFYLTTSMLERGAKVRIIGRHRDRLVKTFIDHDVEVVAADATDLEAIGGAVSDCDLVVDCIGLPPDHMGLHPATAKNIAAVVRATGARCLQVSSFWSYLPVATLPLTEGHPREGGNELIRARRAAEDALQQAGAAVVQLPDFYGPRVHSSSLQQPLQEAVAGKPMNWIGTTAPPREYVFVPDAMATVANLAARPEAYGERWIIPGAGPISGEEVRTMVSNHLGRRITLRTAGPWMLWFASLFSKPLRQFMPMVQYYVEPINYDGSKLRDLIGEQPVTSYAEGIGRTLDWLRT